MKKIYSTPFVDVVTIRCEHSIAAGSATINVGSSQDQFTPQVDDWNGNETRTNDFDI